MTLAVARGHSATMSPRKHRWRTPPDLIAARACEVGGFALDAAAEHGAQVCEKHIPPEQDCLVADWAQSAGVRLDATSALAPLYGYRALRWAWFNPPWGAPYTRCTERCTKEHVHHAESFPGTAAFVEAAIRNVQAAPQLACMMLVPTAPDTAWWRAAFIASVEIRLLPRVAFVDPDTGEIGDIPPGAGVTLFFLADALFGEGEPRGYLADVLGNRLLPTSYA